ncbi:MAG: T9SS type A sorting domain-containing protein, partial [Candidatus Kapaibacterium sp.]
PQGEGFVSFSVKLKDNVNSGETIKNNATIVFDENPAITTNTWVNIIDTIAPVTNSLAANYIEAKNAISIQVDAADNNDGSGVGEMSYFVSIDGTPFQLIGSGFDTEISYEANLDKGKIYRFYAVSTDNVGNQENKVPQITEVDITAQSSVEDMSFGAEVNIYPNPVSNILSIDFVSENAKPVSYQLTDMSGKVMIEGNFAPGIGLSNYNLNISDFTTGVYILRLNQNRKQGIYKIIKQ